MTMVICKVLLGAMLTLFNLSAASESRATQEGGAGQNAGAASNAPRVENAKMETRGVAGTLAATLADAEKKSAGAMWIGYSVKAVAGKRSVCCGNYSDDRDGTCGKCQLENNRHYGGDTRLNDSKTTGALKLEGGEQLAVLFRLQGDHITRIRLASEDCVLDAGGLPFFWLTDVKSAESVAVLAEYVRKSKGGEHVRDSIGNEGLTAIALHEGATAQAALESFVAPAQPEELRKQAAFWLGEARGKEGLEVLRRMAKQDPSAEVRAHVA
ncbi:MAG: HEAT repeat domain-containing protein, partial [Acidobacteriota bacterium]|nr:HEAT repeat domain-containing protein [Acidobacteriota bacterium]